MSKLTQRNVCFVIRDIIKILRVKSSVNPALEVCQYMIRNIQFTRMDAFVFILLTCPLSSHHNSVIGNFQG